MFKARVHVLLKPGVLDPQGSAVQKALQTMEYRGVQEVRIGRYIEIYLESESKEKASREVEEMCQRLLANPVIEDFTFEVVEETS